MSINHHFLGTQQQPPQRQTIKKRLTSFVSCQRGCENNYRRAHWNVSKCIERYLNVLKCTKMYWKIPKCFEMYQNVLKCTNMYWNVPKCIEMYQYVLKCTNMYWDQYIVNSPILYRYIQNNYNVWNVWISVLCYVRSSGEFLKVVLHSSSCFYFPGI